MHFNYSIELPFATVSNIPATSSNIVDILRAAPSTRSFSERVSELRLSSALETKIITNHRIEEKQAKRTFLTAQEEKELATEVLLTRHRFTCQVFENRIFRQATLTIIQNIYLFRNRRIFFDNDGMSGEQERQEALRLFTNSPATSSISLSKTFQHMILARVWDRIINNSPASFLESPPFNELHMTVEKLNTLRNIYMLMSIGLVRKLTQRINPVYRQSITHEDAAQIGSFGVARAAYRYSPQTGQRFSTYAARWIYKEIQRQALQGRLIRLSSGIIEQYAKAMKNGDSEKLASVSHHLTSATTKLDDTTFNGTSLKAFHNNTPQDRLEQEENQRRLQDAIDMLPEKPRDIILRRYGLGPYLGKEQPVSEISRHYGVTRGSIYQMEETSLKRLRKFLQATTSSSNSCAPG